MVWGRFLIAPGIQSILGWMHSYPSDEGGMVSYLKSAPAPSHALLCALHKHDTWELWVRSAMLIVLVLGLEEPLWELQESKCQEACHGTLWSSLQVALACSLNSERATADGNLKQGS
eukprot:1550093-Amphidinium_carterae.1